MKKFVLTTALAAGFFAQLLVAQCLQTTNCSPDGCDLTDNDPMFWNAQNFWDAAHSIRDLHESPTDLNITVTDTCGGAVAELSFVLLLDLDGNGVRETAISSDNLPAPGTINMGNAANPNYTGGTPVEFDYRPVLAANKFRFELSQTAASNTRTATVRWVSALAPNNPMPPQLPKGNHLMRWLSGGNVVCEQAFQVRDCKAPTVVCFNGLSVNIMPTGQITIWASDFLQYGWDNATPADQLTYSIRKKGAGAGFPVDANGNPLPGVTFACTEITTNYIELWARDKAGNTGKCETSIIVQDPANNCNPGFPGTPLACAHTEANEPIEDVTWDFIPVNPNPGQPGISKHSDSSGCITLNALPIGNNFTIRPVKDNNPLNGVTTYDLLLISKHILGVDTLDSPYKIIAADANKSGSITAFDILELRKLILGIYVGLPNNTSWRFVLKSHVFPNPLNPFATQFPESIGSPFSLGTTHNFVGLKVGDVNGNAIANNLSGGDTDDRAAASFSIENQSLAPGETALVPVHASENSAWLGFQFSLGFDPAALKIEAIVPAGALPDLGADNFAQPRPGQLNASWHSPSATKISSREPLFYLKIKALQTIQLSEALRLSLSGLASGTSNLASEVYDAAETRQPLGLVFREKTALADAPQLSNLQPNPASDAAFFTLQLPEAASVRLEIFDLSGRLLRSQTTDFQAGTSRVEVPLRDLPSGPLAYRVAAGGTAWSGRFVKK